MSKLAFIFDTVMLKDENNDYYAINLNYRLWEDRYLKTFDRIIVSTRVKFLPHDEISKKRGYTIANGEQVTMHPVTSYAKITDIFIKRKTVKRQLKRIIENVDRVIIRLPSPLGNLACDVCRECRKKYAVEVVACAWDGYRNHGHWAGKMVAPYMFFATRRQCQKAKRVLYVTKKFLQRRYPTKGITTNASNVILSNPDQSVLLQRLEKIKNKNTSDFVLGLVGPLELESKGHRIALYALKILKQKYPNIKIEFLGEGSGKKLKKIVRLEQLENNVDFKGTLPNGEPVLKWMDTLDILLVPSFQEGLPRVLIEAMSRGCPAVGAKTGGIPELINPRMIHKPGNYKKLANDIEKVMNDKMLCVTLAEENFENAKEYVKENLDARRTRFWNDFRDS